jgi:hypothetical protein
MCYFCALPKSSQTQATDLHNNSTNDTHMELHAITQRLYTLHVGPLTDLLYQRKGVKEP